MSPTRPDARRNSSISFKPYTRGVSPILAPTISPVQPDPPAPSTTTDTRQVEHPGFPTHHQYKQVEAAYLQSLTPRRQGKALISQSMFDRIWDVLQQPETPGETAQFRFWARKMFTISKDHHVTLGPPGNASEGPREVLLHDNLLVAIQEQLYDLLCYCHGSTGHGGRDKTCALIRKHYTWVPKDLVSNFIKACPTCIMKKCGHFESMALNTDAKLALGGEGALRCPDNELGSTEAIPWPTGAGRDDNAGSPVLEDDPLEAAYREAALRALATKGLPGMNNLSINGLQSHPMCREVSLYKGLPNGWQYRHNDYASAHAEFMREKSRLATEVNPDGGGLYQRPRIPSIAPLWGPNQFPHSESAGQDLSGDLLPQLGSTSNDGADIETSPSLQYILMHSSKGPEEEEYQSQIDPVLLNMSTDFKGVNFAGRLVGESVGLGASVSYGSSTSIKRTAAPPRLDLESLATERSFQALLAYRESLGDGDDTPDSPVPNWHPGNPSPASSVSSYGSQLSAFPMSRTNSEISPASSTIPTPIEECGSDGSMGKRLGLPQPVEMELSASIQAVCGL